MPWSALPGTGPPTTLVVEGFGRLAATPDQPGIVTDEEDLYSVFRARADLMTWSDTTMKRAGLTSDQVPSPLWAMNEAELVGGGDDSRIGWVQVGLSPGLADPVPALVPLVQCFDDALRRFGTVDLSAVQVTGTRVQPEPYSCFDELMSARNWFRVSPAGRIEALIVLASSALDQRARERLVVLQSLTGPLRFGPMVDVPEGHSIVGSGATPAAVAVPPDGSSVGLPVSLPEWAAGAAAWALAVAIDAARPGEGARLGFAARIAPVG